MRQFFRLGTGWVFLGSAAVGFIVVLVGSLNASRAQQAGDLVGRLSWAEQHCSGAFTKPAREALEEWALSPYYFVGLRLGAAHATELSATLGPQRACRALVGDYESRQSGSWLAGLLGPAFPAPAWVARVADMKVSP